METTSNIVVKSILTTLMVLFYAANNNKLCCRLFVIDKMPAINVFYIILFVIVTVCTAIFFLYSETYKYYLPLPLPFEAAKYNNLGFIG